MAEAWRHRLARTELKEIKSLPVTTLSPALLRRARQLFSQFRAAYLAFHHPAQPPCPTPGRRWLHEFKFDGYRCQLHEVGDGVVIFSKSGREFMNRFAGLREAMLTLPCNNAVIYGEVVACKEDGTLDFRVLHSGNYIQVILCVWAFDRMQLTGEDLRPFPLVARKRRLEVILRRHDHPYVRHSEPLKNGDQLLAECRRPKVGWC
jgi:bifunctional non-homologous end joining protein LigD